MSQYTLLTGATGLVGRYLVRDLLLGGKRLALVVRPSQKETISQRVEGILQMWESELGITLNRPVCFEGDVAEEGAGLDAAARDWIRANCDRVLHNAAVLTFHGVDRAGEPWRTNVGGTQHVLELCRELGIGDLHYVSTAYVCGMRTDTVMEDELDVGQGFRNDYEHSKLLAEKLVREADFLDKLTVYRPAVISGDSKTGYTNTYHGLYLYLRLISVIVPMMPVDEHGVRLANLRLNMNGHEPRNVVPVDWVSQVICRLLDMPEAHGATYHLAPENPITARDVIDFGCRYHNAKHVYYHGDDPLSDEEMTPFEREVHRGMALYEPYLTTDPKFDTTNLRKYAADLPCPPIDEEMLLLYIRFCEQDRWGKRRAPKVSVPFEVGEYLRQRLQVAAEISELGDELQTVGLDIAGPGGGQWRIRLASGQIASLAPGLPADDEPVLHATSSDFAELATGESAGDKAAQGEAAHGETPHDETPHDETPHDETPHGQAGQTGIGREDVSHGTIPAGSNGHLELNGRPVNGELVDSLRRALFPSLSIGPPHKSAGRRAAAMQTQPRGTSSD